MRATKKKAPTTKSKANGAKAVRRVSPEESHLLVLIAATERVLDPILGKDDYMSHQLIRLKGDLAKMRGKK